MGIKMKKIFQYCVYTARMRRALITRYGMTEDFDMVALETVNNSYLGGDASLACSEQTASPWPIKFGRVCRTSGME